MKPLNPPRLFVAAGLMCLGVLDAGASPNEIAINTAGATGFPTLVYGSYTLNAALTSGFEVDGYTFHGNAGDQISLVTSTSTAGLDPVILLRQPDGVSVANAACSGHADYTGQPILCAVALTDKLPKTGTYTLNVSDLGANNGGAYTLHLDQYPPVNNWVGFAYGTPVPYSIDHLGDSDYLAFNVKAGSGFRLNVTTLSAGLDAQVEVWDKNGTLLRSTGCSGHADYTGNPITCTVLMDFTSTKDEYYKVGINDAGWNNIGNYQIGVSCQFGACATGIPSPVPELPMGVMMGLGLAWLKWGSRTKAYRAALGSLGR